MWMFIYVRKHWYVCPNWLVPWHLILLLDSFSWHSYKFTEPLNKNLVWVMHSSCGFAFVFRWEFPRITIFPSKHLRHSLNSWKSIETTELPHLNSTGNFQSSVRDSIFFPSSILLKPSERNSCKSDPHPVNRAVLYSTLFQNKFQTS